MDIEKLVFQSKKGDISSFMTLLKQKENLFFKIAYTYTGNAYDAEDCITEAAIHAFEKIRQLKKYSKFYSWYISILVNTCRCNYRRQQKMVSGEVYLMGEYIPDDTKSVEDRLLLEEILKSLKEDERDLLVLKYMHEFTLKEIAYMMGIAENTVKSKVYRTINKLKKKYRRFVINE